VLKRGNTAKNRLRHRTEFPFMAWQSQSVAMKTKSSSARRGILAGGNWIIDQVKLIDVYPQPEKLANISEVMPGTGGGPYNVLIDLAKSGARFPLAGTAIRSSRTVANTGLMPASSGRPTSPIHPIRT
jgi:hypothetical protein